MYFDSHCHLTDGRLIDDAADVVRRARAAGVTTMVTIGSDEEDSARALALANELDLYSTAGIHPHAASRSPEAFERVRELVAEERVVAVGETGLDYHYDNAPRPAQREMFARHLALAAETGLPVVVHSRDADQDTAAMLAEVEGSVVGVLHCFSGGRGLFDAGLGAGWYVSFSGMVTFPSYDQQELVAATPADRLLIETDAPYLAPVPHRGRRNEPAYVVAVAAAVAVQRGESADRIAGLTSRNARSFYRLVEPDTGPTADPGGH